MEDALHPQVGHRVENLRLRRGVTGVAELVPAPPAMSMAGLRGWQPMCRVGGRLVVSAGTVLATADDSTTDAQPTVCPSKLPGEALCSLASNQDRALVMTTGGACHVEGSGGTVVCRSVPMAYPPVTLHAVSTTVASVVVGGRKLSKTYVEGQSLSVSDRRALVSDLETAYRQASAEGASAVCIVQPVLARYRLLDGRGNELFVSPPVLVSLDEQSQNGGSVEVRCDSSGVTSGYTLQLRCWRIEAVLPSEAMPEVAAVEVMVSPQFHPYSPGGAGIAVVSRDVDGYKIRVGLPGAYAGIDGGNRGGESRLLSAVSHMGAIEKTACRIMNPFTGVGRSVILAYSPEADVVTETQTLSAKLRSKVAAVAYAESLLRMPHTFVATSVATDGCRVAWGAPRVRRFAGYDPRIFATTLTDKPWRATVIVHFDGKRGVSYYAEGVGGCPTAFNPVLQYPSADARSMTILVWCDGVTRRFDCTMTPDASGLQSVYVNANLKPIVPAVTASAVLADIETADETFDELIAIADAGTPLNIKGVVRHGAGRVNAVETVGGAEQAWDRGRSRFYAGCEGGVVSVGVSAGGTSVRIVDERGVSLSDGMAAGGNRIFALLRQGVQHVPVAIDHRGVVTALGRTDNYRSLAYDTSHDEVWALGEDMGATAFTATGSYRRSMARCTGVVKVAGEYYCIHEMGVYRVSAEDTSVGVTIHYTDVYSPTGRCLWQPQVWRSDICSDECELELKVCEADGSGMPTRAIVVRNLRGRLVSPMALRLVCPPLRSVMVSVSGIVNNNTVIGPWMCR